MSQYLIIIKFPGKEELNRMIIASSKEIMLSEIQQLIYAGAYFSIYPIGNMILDICTPYQSLDREELDPSEMFETVEDF